MTNNIMDPSANLHLDEAMEIFLMLSEEEQREIICLLQFLLLPE